MLNPTPTAGEPELDRESSQQARRRSSQARRSGGWVPNQHGAWAMVTVPYVVGLVRGTADHGFGWALIPLGAMWFVGYFTFFALGLWLRSGLRRRYLTAVVVYGSATGTLGVVLLFAAPHLAAWAPAFLPLVGVGLWASLRRAERTIVSGAVTVAAAALMSVVAYDACRDPGDAWGPTPIAGIAVLLFGYFFGTVLYVKSLIRARGKRRYAIASVTYHLTATATTTVAALTHDASWWLAAAFLAAMTARAWLLLGRSVSPKVIGFGEVAASTILLVIVLLLR